MSNIDWSMLRTAAQVKKEAEDQAEYDRIAPMLFEEKEWAERERNFATMAIEAIEDDGDDAPDSGTIAEWRAYRTQVRKWKEGAPGFPYKENRPVRP